MRCSRGISSKSDRLQTRKMEMTERSPVELIGIEGSKVPKLVGFPPRDRPKGRPSELN
jgi:hypothetical protein